MDPITGSRGIVDYCLAPLQGADAEAVREARRRMEHAIRAFERQASRPVAVDFSNMPSQVINEAAHGNE